MERRRGIATEISSDDLKRWLSTGDLGKPYSEPTNVSYSVAAARPEERCAVCEYFGQGICSNPAVAQDPRVPETYDGLKIVAAGGWCGEFAPLKVTV